MYRPPSEAGRSSLITENRSLIIASRDSVALIGVREQARARKGPQPPGYRSLIAGHTDSHVAAAF
jgi:hypothetical protein